MPKAYIIARRAISYRRYITRSCQGTDIIEKDRFLSKPVFFLVGEAGLEPARPEWTLEPESSESANSTTRPCADCSDNIPQEKRLVNHFFLILQNIFPLQRQICVEQGGRSLVLSKE